ncbi:aminotransferase class V-fold PLP-dependent enzyme [Allomuricauda sp. d1]|uniref:aminotransferase class V-fold PLP-dependent enzyme n=1 Tax=Allomuricauda sp. d1 TaxID=3136725 RepID=UPI0031DD9EDC
MENIRAQFPVLEHCIYANTAFSGLFSKDLVQWRQNRDTDFLLKGSAGNFGRDGTIPETRKTIAQFFGAKKHEISLVTNFSIGFNLLMEGLPKSSNVLLLKKDYPSVNWPVEDRGFKIHYAKIDENLEENVDEVIRQHDIDVFVFSIVQWLDGILMDLDFIKRLKKDFPNLLIVADGTQFCGMYDFDFERSGIDVLGASGYKWLLAGYGNGFFIIRETAQERFAIKSIGSGSVGGDPSKRDQIPFYKYLEPGHLDSLNFGSLKFALEFLQKIGMDKITEHNKILSEKAKHAFTELGLLKNSCAARENHSTIFNVRGETEIFQKLTKKNVVCVERGDGIRLSFHCYNVVGEIDEIVKIVKN